VRLLYEGDQVRSMSTASAFDVVGMDSPTFERGCSLFYKSGLVEGVGVELALDIVLVADPM